MLKFNYSDAMRLMMALCMICVCQLVTAQTSNYQGIVKDAKGETLPGVAIVETGTTNGVSTDSNGKFEIEVEPGKTLTVSYVGYVTRIIPINKNTTWFFVTLGALSYVLNAISLTLSSL